MEEGSETALELGSKFKDSTIIFLKCNVLVESEVKGLSEMAYTSINNIQISLIN